MSGRFEIATGKLPLPKPEPIKKATLKQKRTEELTLKNLKNYSNIEILIETFGLSDRMLIKFMGFLKKIIPKVMPV
jgi:hypothetical protein